MHKSTFFFTTRSIFRALKPLLNKIHIRSTFLNVAESKELRISITTPIRRIKAFLLMFRPMLTEHDLVLIGAKGDGGYLVPETELTQIDACFSIGCNFLWDFEKEIGERYSIPSIIVDDITKKPPNLSPMQTYVPKWLGRFSDENVISLEELVNESQFSNSKDLLLQMDIEGSEFECIIHTPREVLQQFRVIVIEIHNLQNVLHHHLFMNAFYPLMNLFIEDFEVVHVHPNNACSTWEYKDIRFPEVIEVTFLRRDRIKAIGGYAELPHKLDQLNAPDNPPISINWESLL